jgi:plastocyanin
MFAVAAAALLATTAACGTGSPTAAGSSGSSMPGTPPATTVAPNRPTAPNEVDIANFAFVPATLSVRVGTTVTWTNQDEEAHDVSERSGRFHSPVLNTGDTFHFTFTQAGQYQYLCTIHPFMTATVVVTP